MSTSVFVDGQSRRFYLEAKDRLHGPLSGEFRPMTFEQVERSEATLASFGENTGKRCAAIVGVIAKQIVSWDVKDAAGGDVSANGDNMRKLHPRLINRLFLVVTGRDGGDAPPGEAIKSDEPDEFAAELLAAGGGDGTIGEQREAATAKN